ncbi:hypothetical protein WR25_00418 [Diploscapter pachys]|uniref:Uncharacterized protein n=1 Tax=Diploscapter pachys TaxID=2018661 RepID=A0A2A2JW86_9BILA|nr:hypothetical protein WR25_00418 [Diploscapter pachys]
MPLFCFGYSHAALGWNMSLFEHLPAISLSDFQKHTKPCPSGLRSSSFGETPNLAVTDGIQELMASVGQVLGFPPETIRPYVIVALPYDQPRVMQKHNVIGELHRRPPLQLNLQSASRIMITRLNGQQDFAH